MKILKNFLKFIGKNGREQEQKPELELHKNGPAPQH
jgi:hypothetical protein